TSRRGNGDGWGKLFLEIIEEGSALVGLANGKEPDGSSGSRGRNRGAVERRAKLRTRATEFRKPQNSALTLALDGLGARRSHSTACKLRKPVFNHLAQMLTT